MGHGWFWSLTGHYEKMSSGSSDILLIIIAYIMSMVVIATVIQRLYEHTKNFTPPYLRTYRQLMAARGLVESGALAFDDHEQSGLFTSVPAVGRGGEEGEGSAGPSQRTTHEIVEVDDPGMHLSAEVLAQLEEDLRGSSFRERERLSAALGAELPTGQSFFFPIRSNSSRTILPPEFDLNLNGNFNSTASQSARFTRVIVSPAPSSSYNYGLGQVGGGLPPHRLSSFRFDPRSLSSRMLVPPEFDRNFNRASQSARFAYVNRASSSASSPSTSRPGSYRWTTNRAPHLTPMNPQPHRSEIEE